MKVWRMLITAVTLAVLYGCACIQQESEGQAASPGERGEQIGKGCVQIALGTGNGARHVAEGAVKVYRGTKLPPGVTVPAGVSESEILGPVVVAEETFRITHPEHPHHRLPAGTYQTTYQIDMRTMRRVVD